MGMGTSNHAAIPDLAPSLYTDDLGLHEAVSAQDWAQVIRILEDTSLLLVRKPGGMAYARRALEAMPPEVRALHPELQPHFEFVGLSQVADIDPNAANQILLEGGETSARAVRRLTVSIVSLRLNHHTEKALEVVKAVEEQVLIAADRVGAAAEAAASGFFAQAAKTYLLAGDIAHAHAAYMHAWRWRHQDELGFVAHEAASTIAAIHAASGRLDQAEEWLARAAEWPVSISPDYAAVVDFAEPLASFIVAFERLDFARAAEFLPSLAQPTQGFEFFYWVIEMRARCFLFSGFPNRALQLIDETEEYLEPHTAQRLRAGALLQSGKREQALSLSRTLNEPVTVALIEARAAALENDFKTALETIETAIPLALSRKRLDLLALQAMCLLAVGRREAARAVFSDLLLGLNGCLSVFTTIHPSSLRALFELTVSHPLSAEVEREWLSRSAGPLYQFTPVLNTAEVTTLTPRELVILRYVVSGLSRKEIALRETVSINTVKSQVRSAFRKLAVTNTQEAKVRCIELGLF